MKRIGISALFLIISILILSGFVFYNIANQVVLSGIDISSFPSISFLVDPWDISGNFISDLEPEEMLVIENEHEIEVDDLQELNLGAQIVIAHNNGVAFTVSGEDEIPRSELLSDELVNFFELLDPETKDSISIVTPNGILFSNQQNRNMILSSWEAYEHDFFETLPNLNVLSLAVDLASDPAPIAGMGKTVLFLTPLIELHQSEVLQDLTDRAIQSRIRIHIGFIGRVTDFQSEEAAMLRGVADQTGGQYFAYSLNEDIPDLNSMFESSRRIYQLTYSSHTSASGTNQVSVVIDTGVGNITSEMKNFEIEIQPPNPIFLSLPGSIERHFPEEKEILLRNLEPKNYIIEILVDFPDKHPREVKNTKFYVNNELIGENKFFPFDQFTLRINDYQQETRLILKVTAEDELGLVGQSLEIPLIITIKDPAHDISEILSSNYTNLILVVFLSAVGIGVLFLILSGKMRPLMRVERLYKRAKQVSITDQDLKKSSLDEKEQTGPLSRIRFSGEDEYIMLAELHMIDPETGKFKDRKLNIIHDEIYIGSDVSQAQILIDDPTVESVHAFIRRQENGVFTIADMGTTAGTWLNYDPVSESGKELKNGDVIHIGSAAFRFHLPGEEQGGEIEIKYIDDGEK